MELGCAERGRFARLPLGHRHELPDTRRAPPERLQREIHAVARSPVVTAVLEVADAVLLVLNLERQIVAFNSRVAAVRDPSDVLGLRPGEALSCINASGPGGCGTAPGCSTCGALGSILASQVRGGPVESECLIRSQRMGALEFNVRATPVEVGEFRFTVVSLRDISAEKRREALEQVFFHDVLNTVAGLRGWVELLRRKPEDARRVSERVEFLTRQVEREIVDHRALQHAENGTLVPQPEAFPGRALLDDVDVVFAGHPTARERRLDIDGQASDEEIVTDRALALRVLVNMVRNAFEATPPGGTVRLTCRNTSGGVLLAVHNPGVIPAEVQERIFQRSFSTKSAHGRGLGTYSMKLFGERYLGGQVSFTSTAAAGTEFRLLLPVRPAG